MMECTSWDNGEAAAGERRYLASLPMYSVRQDDTSNFFGVFGASKLVISLKISFMTPCSDDTPDDCITAMHLNLFDFTDPSETKNFSFDVSFQGTVAAFGRKGIVPSAWDNKYNFLHNFSLRDSESICSFHVDLNSNGTQPTKGTIHIDSVNPNAGFRSRVAHGLADLVPDSIKRIGLPIPTGASFCH